MEQHYFPIHTQKAVTKVINYALHKKQYPHDLCGLMDKKLQLLEQADTEIPEKDNPDAVPVKVRSVVILEMLKQMRLGMAYNDLSKICKLIAFLTGNSYNSIYNELQKGVYFSNFHGKQIDEANKILAELNASISIDKNKQY